MTERLRRDEAFWKLVEALDTSGVLPHVMIIGTWAEWLYKDYFAVLDPSSEYRVDVGKTHDIDVYFRDYLMDIDGAECLRDALDEAGFIPGSDYKGTFFHGGIEVEFLAGTAGTGRGIHEIPSVGIKAERLEELSILVPTWIDCHGYHICIPTPASYIAQKLCINPIRKPEHKRAQDIRKVAVLLNAMANINGQIDELATLLQGLPEQKRAIINETASANGIALPA